MPNLFNNEVTLTDGIAKVVLGKIKMTTNQILQMVI